MLLTSLGSKYWPRTAEGRVLCFILALYGFAVFVMYVDDCDLLRRARCGV